MKASESAAAKVPGTLSVLLQGGVCTRYLRAEVHDGVLLLTITAAQLLDDVVEQGLLQEMLSAVAGAGTYRVIVDLHSVEAVSSAAMGAIVSFGDFLKDHRGRLVLCCLSSFVTEEFRLAKLTASAEAAHPLETAADLQEAQKIVRP
jgi:anti-anti-sigma factor